MSTGKSAVLAGDNSGYRSVMEPREDLLFNPYDTHVLATKLAILLENKANRLEAAAWGRDHARQYDTEVVGQQLLKNYVRALHKRRAA
jgi:glycosyltransferase involved in cell wall biosynthesis